MNSIQVLKVATRLFMMFGSSKVVGGIIQTNVPVSGPISRALVYGTTFVIGGYAAEKLGRFTDVKIDELVEVLEGRRSVTLI